MSDIVDIAAAIRSRFATEVATPNTLQVAHDNAPFTPPASGRWARLTVLFGVQTGADFGAASKRYRTAGVAMAQLFEPIGIGDGAQLALVSDVQDAFRGVSLPGPPHIAFQPPYVSAPPARDEQGGYWLTVVTIPFRADEFS